LQIQPLVINTEAKVEESVEKSSMNEPPTPKTVLETGSANKESVNKEPVSPTVTKKKIVKQQKTYPKMICNVAHTRYPVLRKVVRRDFKMKLSEEDVEEFDLIWCDGACPMERVMRLKPW
jgi:hypothetical protein